MSTITIPYSVAVESDNENVSLDEDADPVEAMTELADDLEDLITDAVDSDDENTSFVAIMEEELDEAVTEAVNNGESFAGMDDVADVQTTMNTIEDSIETTVETTVVEGTNAPTPALPEDDDEIAGLEPAAFYSVVIVVPIVGLALIFALGYFAASSANSSAAASQFRNVQMT